MRMRTHGCHRMVTEASKTTNFRAHFFITRFYIGWQTDITFCIGKFFQAGERNQQSHQL